MRVAIKVSIDLFKSDENRSQHRVNIKPIHVKIEWISIQNRSDINLKWFKIDLKIIKSCSWSEQISAQNQSDSNLNWFKIWLENHSKTGSWSHVGSRWHLLGAILAQDEPEDRFFIDFWSIWGSKMHPKSIQKPSNFQTSLETLFSANRVHKSSKMRVQNHSKMKPFLGRVKNRESCSRLHADLVFEV